MLLDDVPGVEIIDEEPLREIVVGLTYRLRVKRHRDEGQISSYPTQTALEWAFRWSSWASVGLVTARLAGYIHPIRPFLSRYRYFAYRAMRPTRPGNRVWFAIGPEPPELAVHRPRSLNVVQR